MRRFGRRKCAGFTEFIDRRSPSTKDEILAGLLTHGDSTLHLGVDVLKRWMGEYIFQTVLRNIAKEKVRITRMAEREEFGGEGRDIAVTIKNDQ